MFVSQDPWRIDRKTLVHQEEDGNKIHTNIIMLMIITELRIYIFIFKRSTITTNTRLVFSVYPPYDTKSAIYPLMVIYVTFSRSRGSMNIV